MAKKNNSRDSDIRNCGSLRGTNGTRSGTVRGTTKTTVKDDGEKGKK